MIEIKSNEINKELEVNFYFSDYPSIDKNIDKIGIGPMLLVITKNSLNFSFCYRYPQFENNIETFEQFLKIIGLKFMDDNDKLYIKTYYMEYNPSFYEEKENFVDLFYKALQGFWGVRKYGRNN